MLSITEKLSQIVGKAFKTAGFDASFGTVIVSDRPDLSQFQCNGALAAAKKAGVNPREVAQAVMDVMTKTALFSDISIAGPGFINLTLKDDYLLPFLQQMMQDAHLGATPVKKPQTVIVDYGGPNVAKPMHVGHLRSTIIGDSIQRTLRWLGEKVITDIHLGDWGLQMGMIIEELKLRQPKLPYFDATITGSYPSESPVSIEDLEEMYPKAALRCKEDEKAEHAAMQATVELQKGRAGYVALWKHFVSVSLVALKKDFAELGVTFDLWNGESAYESRIPKMVTRLKKKQLAVESQGALVIQLPKQEGEKELPPLLLEKSDGAYLYSTSDLATVEERVKDFKAKKIIYVVDKRQSLHFKQVFAAAVLTGIAKKNIELFHAGFGTMNGKDGKPFKTRAGGVVKLKDLIDTAKQKALERMGESKVAADVSAEEQKEIAEKVGIAAIKFADLINHRESDYIFDFDKFVSFEGKTGPYLLYTAVRMRSILKKAGYQPPSEVVFHAQMGPEARQVVLTMLTFPDVIAKSMHMYTPHVIAEWLYEVSRTLNVFYGNCPILTESDESKKQFYLYLCHSAFKQLETGCSLLGITIPQRM